MLKNWFECRIRYEKVKENGKSKKGLNRIWWMR